MHLCAQMPGGPAAVLSRDSALPLGAPMRASPHSRHASRPDRSNRVKAAAATVVGAVTALVVATVTSEGAVQALTMPRG
jgi:hypothetical protein